MSEPMTTIDYPISANRQFALEFIQLDAQMQLQASYEDQFGETIETMTQEEWRAERERRKGMVIMRLVVRSGGEQIAFESRVGAMDERQALVRELMLAVTKHLEKWVVTG